MWKNILKFAHRNRKQDDYEPVGALATDTGKSFVLEGDDAERFVREMEENERRIAERTEALPTREDLQNELEYSRIILQFEERELDRLKTKIKMLEEALNGETEES